MQQCLPILLALAFCASTARAEERFALVIGANTGWELDKPLKHAQSDAERMASVLVELGRFPKDRVTVLLDPDTNVVRARLDALSTLAARTTGPTLVFVYYSGHSDSGSGSAADHEASLTGARSVLRVRAMPASQRSLRASARSWTT